MSDLCPPLIPSGIEKVGGRAHVPAACTRRNGEKLSLSRSPPPEQCTAKSIFAVQRSIIDNCQRLTVLKRVPAVAFAAFCSLAASARSVYFKIAVATPKQIV